MLFAPEPKNIWFNQLRKRRNGPQMVDIEAEDSVANNIVEQFKNSHDLYVSKLEAEQVRAAIQETSPRIKPGNIAYAAVFLASEESRMTTGHILPVDRGIGD